MTISHKLLPDNQLHEPKGVASAAVNTVYSANGAGSGTWKKVGSTGLQGLSGDAGVADKFLLTDGANGFVLKPQYSRGQMSFWNNGNAFAMTAVADTTLTTGSQYSLLTGTGAPFVSQNLKGVTFLTDKLTVVESGVYEVNLWATLVTFPSNTAKVAFRYRVNGTTISDQKVMTKSNAAGDAKNVSAGSFVTLTAGDYLQIMVASDATGNLVISDMSFYLNLLEAA